MPGPAPMPDAHRKSQPSRDLPWVDLPVSWSGEPPVCAVSLGRAGKLWWDRAWVKPQASQWEALGVVELVERRAELADLWAESPSAALSGEMRQVEHMLGLSPKAMKELRWRIEGTEGARQPVRGRSKSKRRSLKVVGDG